LLLVQSKALDEAPYKLSRAIAKLAGMTFWSLAFSYCFDKPRFLIEGKTYYCAHHTFLLGFPTRWLSARISIHFILFKPHKWRAIMTTYDSSRCGERLVWTLFVFIFVHILIYVDMLIQFMWGICYLMDAS
jgi:hypothetical protein